MSFEVSPRIGVGDFFGGWGLAVIRSELLWVWLPASPGVACVIIFRRRRPSGPAPPGA